MSESTINVMTKDDLDAFWSKLKGWFVKAPTATVTADTVALFDGTTGKTIKSSGKTIETSATQSSSNLITSGAVWTGLNGKLSTTLKGAANGLAELDANGLVPSSQLPSYVDDVLEYASKSAFPSTGTSGKIYVALDTNLTYRWSGTAYVEISPSLALGETSSTAYRGDRGAIAYSHATDANRLTTAQTSGFYKFATTAEGHIASVTAVTASDLTSLIGSTTYAPYNANGYLPLSGGTMTGNITMGKNSIKFNVTTDSDWNIGVGISETHLRILNAAGGTATGAPNNYAVCLSVKGYYGFQIASYGGGSDNFFIRNIGNGSSEPRAWVTLYHSGNSNKSTVDWATKKLTASDQIVSNVATGTAPLSIASTTLVSNLNADLLDGKHSSDFVSALGTSGDYLTWTKTGGNANNIITPYASLATDTRVENLTNQTITYRQTAGGGLTYKPSAAVLKRVLGNSVVWNQLVNTSTSTVTIPNGRKYYGKISGTAAIGTSDGTAISVTGGTDTIVDLTLFFNGNIPTGLTAETFERDYGYLLTNPEYNAGTIINNAAKAIETVGFNLWDEEVGFGGINSTTGADSSSDTTARTTNFIPVFGNTTYYIKSSQTCYTRYYDANKNYLGYLSKDGWGSRMNGIITTPDNCRYMRFVCDTMPAAGTICINLSNSSRNGQYEPYRKNTLPLNLNSFRVKDAQGNIVTINGLKKAGSVYDEIVGKKFIQRVGKKEFKGSENGWTLQSINSYNIANFQISILDNKDSTNNICNLFQKQTSLISVTQTEGYMFGGTNEKQFFIRINSSKASTVTGLKTWLSSNNVELNYELATPIEYEIIDDFPTTYAIDTLGTEAIPEGEQVAPFIADIQYGARQTDIAYDIDNLFVSSVLLRGRSTTLEGYFTDGIANNAARLSNTSAIGSTTKPVYFTANGVPSACSTYAGGTAVTLNGSSKAASTASFYAPTGAGTAGQILKSTAGTPEWINQSALVAGSADKLSDAISLYSDASYANKYRKIASIILTARYRNGNGTFHYRVTTSPDENGGGEGTIYMLAYQQNALGSQVSFTFYQRGNTNVAFYAVETDSSTQTIVDIYIKINTIYRRVFLSKIDGTLTLEDGGSWLDELPTGTRTIEPSFTARVGKADALTTSRTLWGQSFNGTANVSGNMSSVGDISFSASGKKIGGFLYFDTTNNRLGVGTPSPSERLAVDGNAIVYGKITASNDITSVRDIYALGGMAAYGIATLDMSGGTLGVTQVNVGSTAYTPTNGIVSLPAYPTWSTLSGAPTNLSAFSDDVGYLTNMAFETKGGVGTVTGKVNTFTYCTSLAFTTFTATLPTITDTGKCYVVMFYVHWKSGYNAYNITSSHTVSFMHDFSIVAGGAYFIKAVFAGHWYVSAERVE